MLGVPSDSLERFLEEKYDGRGDDWWPTRDGMAEGKVSMDYRSY